MSTTGKQTASVLEAQKDYISSALLALVTENQALVKALQQDNRKEAYRASQAAANAYQDIETYMRKVQYPAVALYMKKKATNG